MNKRKSLEMKMQAGLHGATIKNEYSKSLNVDKDFDKLKSMGINVVEE